MTPLREYIAQHWDTQADFARAQGVQRQLVTQWLEKGFVVNNHTLYLPRRVLKLDFETKKVSQTQKG